MGRPSLPLARVSEVLQIALFDTVALRAFLGSGATPSRTRRIPAAPAD
jgi:hypothetical protein